MQSQPFIYRSGTLRPRGAGMKWPSRPVWTCSASETERQGFEPWRPLRAYRFSRPAHSAALAPLRILKGADYRIGNLSSTSHRPLHAIRKKPLARRETAFGSKRRCRPRRNGCAGAAGVRPANGGGIRVVCGRGYRRIRPCHAGPSAARLNGSERIDTGGFEPSEP